jgi:hypothetical protein
MIRVLKTPDGKKVNVDIKEDECLYNAPRNINCGEDTTRGIDLYRHVSRKGNAYYYKVEWSMWQGEGCYYELVSEDEAKEFLLDKAELAYPIGLTQDEMKRAQELFPNIFEEDA